MALDPGKPPFMEKKKKALLIYTFSSDDLERVVSLISFILSEVVPRIKW